ncbi:hypothetical protein TVAG_391230 [Trichomonas vaginalis G3]|uniref:Uncharacterized protein n=1 Tax=Trichomonas vaginalis (strain ATCC PRA-98 / G3) TaxID=412133 RepID=A2DFN6_TRIV3|nr:hypothetical protein TVAGG3_0323740 [Trichomonas vaginalis G3]EAY20739.1 hypothetical protein TVAG_391230 [Trichomonas vaginalis G3]KAI5529486.1 hypothetical protein TVAGG3_0323740 [Trichomonas vaginalis G3]|eukprot:XP_001581725.1 hypothetical protein [Trichomonas vaginalis G3]
MSDKVRCIVTYRFPNSNVIYEASVDHRGSLINPHPIKEAKNIPSITFVTEPVSNPKIDVNLFDDFDDNPFDCFIDPDKENIQ